MFFKDLTRAINRLASSVYSLSVAIRGEIEVPEPTPEAQDAQFDRIMSRIKAEEAIRAADPTRNKPMGSVFYANEDADGSENIKEEILEYLEQRGYDSRAMEEAKVLFGKVD